MRTLPCLLLVVSLALAPGCGVTAPLLGVGPVAPGDPTLLDDALSAVRGAGYRPVGLDAEAGRFEVLAQSDGSGATRFVVQCFADGWVSIVPVGPRIQRRPGGFSMSGSLRNEYGRLAEELDEALAATR